MVLCKIISFRSLGEKLKFVMKSPSLVTKLFTLVYGQQFPKSC